MSGMRQRLMSLLNATRVQKMDAGVSFLDNDGAEIAILGKEVRGWRWTRTPPKTSLPYTYKHRRDAYLALVDEILDL